MPDPTVPAGEPAPRRRLFLPLAAMLAGLAIVVAGLAWFAFANREYAGGDGTARYVLAANSGTAAGRWHWLDIDGRIGAPIGDESLIVPGDVLGFVGADGTLTDATFSLPVDAGNETQDQEFTVAADGDIFRLVPVGGTVDARYSLQWIVLGGTAVALGLGAALTFRLGSVDESATPPSAGPLSPA